MQRAFQRADKEKASLSSMWTCKWDFLVIKMASNSVSIVKSWAWKRRQNSFRRALQRYTYFSDKYAQSTVLGPGEKNGNQNDTQLPVAYILMEKNRPKSGKWTNKHFKGL